MKVAQYVADFLASISPRVYGLVGAGAMHLNDAICHHPGIQFIAMHHEQAAAMAAEADARVTNKIGVVHVTAGPGGTNAITGVAGAYVDSIPMLVIAGQVTKDTSSHLWGLRQFGTNELPVADIMRRVTKDSARVDNPQYIRMYLERAVDTAMSGRRGPVFLEIPLDVQAADVDPTTLVPHIPNPKPWPPAIEKTRIAEIVDAMKRARRPLLIVGNGVHLAGAEDDLARFVEISDIPVVTSWNGIDLLDSDDTVVIGRPGVMGDRAGNFAVQNCDLLIAIGTRLSVPQTGHAQRLYAQQAGKIIVDIDEMELTKPVAHALNVDLVQSDAGAFLRQINGFASWLDIDPWRAQCLAWKKSYPVMLPEYRESKDGVNAYAFIEELGKHLDDDAIVVTDVGAAYQATHQSLQIKRGQRLFHSGGVSAMGVGIPLAIGAASAGGGRQVICLVGDGGAAVNIQELETIARYDLPITIFVFHNGGYMTMQHTQETHFGRESASGRPHLTFPSMMHIATACGLEFGVYSAVGDASRNMVRLLRERRMNGGWQRKPLLCSVHMQERQILAPRLQSKLGDKGEFILPAFDDMWPHLPAAEMHQARGLPGFGLAPIAFEAAE